MTRKFTNVLYRMMDEGILDPKTVLDACLMWMSEDDVRNMMYANDLVTDYQYDLQENDND